MSQAPQSLTRSARPLLGCTPGQLSVATVSGACNCSLAQVKFVHDQNSLFTLHDVFKLDTSFHQYELPNLKFDN